MKNFASYRIRALMIALFISVFLAGCSTKKNTFTRRLYHNLTSHYNVYWNGKEALLEAEKELEASIKDNYNQILPVYNFGTEKDATNVAPLLDRAIEKGSKTILKHSMYFGGKEYVRWIDDAYMLIGKAFFYKQDYYSARRSFNFVMREFEENPSKYTAMLWLAKTYNQLAEFEKTEPLLNLVLKDLDREKMPREVFKELSLVYADYYILQERYYDATTYLYDGIEVIGDKQTKTRLKFILAQIYQKEAEYEQAYDLYREVIKRNPVYEMAFNARINMARSYVSGTGDLEGIMKILNKMLNNEKNKEFQDQIYFALAEVAFKENNDTLGIYYLKKSVQTSMANNYQKATSALKLADIYFAMPEYELAQAYYDTTIQFLPEDYPDYSNIKLKTANLTELVVNLKTIQLEDSLQRIALMSEEERAKVIEKLIEKKREEDRKKAEQELLAQQAAEFGAMAGPTQSFGQPEGGAWYFYNPTTKSYGYSEFIGKWGNRKLEDLWRLKDKKIISFEPEEVAEISLDTLAGQDSTLLLARDPYKMEYYLKDLPLTEEEMEKSDEKIIDAFYNLGLIYWEGLKNDDKAIASYQELLERYPDNPYQLRVYYQLYRLFLEKEDEENADYYRKLIISRFPDSDYARIIQDPDYYKEVMARETQLASLYRDTYEAYLSGSYFTVIDNSDLAFAQYGDTASLIPKFAYLKALSIGKIDIVDSLVIALQNVIDMYPASEVKPLAENILEYIAKDRPDLVKNLTQKESDSAIIYPYNYNEDITHLYMLIVKKEAVKLNPTKVKISDFNKKYYRIKELTINSVLLNQKYYLITVGNFKEADEAMKYFNTIKDNEYVFSDIARGNYEQFIISTDNYPIFYKDKNMETYGMFFGEFYMK